MAGSKPVTLSTLPLEILVKILGYVFSKKDRFYLKNLVRFGCVCISLRRAVANPQFWERLFIKGYASIRLPKAQVQRIIQVLAPYLHAVQAIDLVRLVISPPELEFLATKCVHLTEITLDEVRIIKPELPWPTPFTTLTSLKTSNYGKHERRHQDALALMIQKSPHLTRCKLFCNSWKTIELLATYAPELEHLVCDLAHETGAPPYEPIHLANNLNNLRYLALRASCSNWTDLQDLLKRTPLLHHLHLELTSRYLPDPPASDLRLNHLREFRLYWGPAGPTTIRFIAGVCNGLQKLVAEIAGAEEIHEKSAVAAIALERLPLESLELVNTRVTPNQDRISRLTQMTGEFLPGVAVTYDADIQSTWYKEGIFTGST